MKETEYQVYGYWQRSGLGRSSNTRQKTLTLISNSRLSMSFPGLYDEVTHVSTEPPTVPTVAAVLTHVIHLLISLLVYESTYGTCTRTYYTCC